MVDVTKPIVNPRLSEALAALHRENTPANQDRALRELMTQAHLLAPVVLTPAPSPAVSGQTTLEQNTAIQFQLISSQEGRPFFPAFTNWGELRKLCGPRDQQTLVLTFDDYASMLQRDSRAAGFVVDPFGDSLTLGPGDGGPPGPAEGRGHSTGPAGDSEGYPSHAGGPGGVPGADGGGHLLRCP